MTIIQGFDTRHWDGIIPPAYLDQFKFYFQKVSQGQGWTPNEGWTQLQKNWKRTKDVYKLPRGAYHYTLEPYIWLDPVTYGKAQADNFFNTIAEHFEGDYGELPPVIDLEHRRTGISGECRVKCYRALLDRTAELWNQAPMIYTAGWYWDTYVHPYVGDWKYWEEHELWEADPPPDTPIKGWVDGGVVLQVALSSPLDGWKDPKGYQGKVDINETEDSWLAKHWQPIPPPNCEEEVTKALAAQKIIYEKEIARLQDENAQLQIDVYNQALDDVKGTINNMYKE